MKSGNLKVILVSAVLMTGLSGPAADSRAKTNAAATRATASSARSATVDEKAPGPERKARALPYRGKLVSVDKQRSSLTVGTRVFHVTPKTRIEKDGKSATLTDGVQGQIVTGSYRKLPDGTLEAGSVYYGGKPDASPTSKKKTASATTAKEKQDRPD